MRLQNELIFTMIEQVKIILNSYDLTNFQVSVIILLILSFLFIIKSLYRKLWAEFKNKCTTCV